MEELRSIQFIFGSTDLGRKETKGGWKGVSVASWLHKTLWMWNEAGHSNMVRQKCVNMAHIRFCSVPRNVKGITYYREPKLTSHLYNKQNQHHWYTTFRKTYIKVNKSKTKSYKWNKLNCESPSRIDSKGQSAAALKTCAKNVNQSSCNVREAASLCSCHFFWHRRYFCCCFCLQDIVKIAKQVPTLILPTNGNKPIRTKKNC